MKKLVILGAGTAGTMMANHLNKELDDKLWQISIIDKQEKHYYQPGFLFVPFGIYEPKDTVKPIEKFIPKKVGLIKGEVDVIEHENNRVRMEDGRHIDYDILIIATGSRIAPEEVEGLTGDQWYKSIFDFYTYDGAVNLRKKLDGWEGGKLVVHITEMPIKCPVAPLEFAFLADSYFKNKGMRDKVEISYVTPLDGAFTKPKAASALGHLLEEKGIKIVPDFAIEHVDNEKKKIVDYAENEVEFDLLVTIPTNMGDPLIERSGIGDELNFVPTNPKTLQSEIAENIFVIGDATNCPTSKAGSVAHFEAEVLTENIYRFIQGDPLKDKFDGHANCFVETGEGKALLIDFNYNHQPVEGTFPIPGIGPLKLLKETRMNHIGKLAFKWVYWNMLLKGTPIPFVGTNMSEAGKKFDN